MTVTDDTTYEYQMGGAPSGDAPSGGPSSDDSSSDNSESSTDSNSGPSNNQPPAKPDDSSSGDMPSGGTPSGIGGQQEASLDSLTEGTHVIITLNDDGTAKTVTIVQSMDSGMPGGQGGGQSSADVTYSSDNEISEDGSLSDQTIDSTGTDEEAVLVDNGATASLSGLTINHTSSDVDLSGAATADSWETYETAKPSELS